MQAPLSMLQEIGNQQQANGTAHHLPSCSVVLVMLHLAAHVVVGWRVPRRALHLTQVLSYQ